jgi:peptidoglycan/LPS O-acetylase OafA/YrhL
LTHLDYRKDIDGLRALAVMSVVSFHSFPEIFTSGFIGVDMFFVISGYLISKIIFTNLAENTFSISDFYGRRIRRIFPSLILIFLTAIFFGWFVLFADEYAQLGKHVAGGASFISNFILYSESGYFDNSAITKPMLHLWSLSIEEQFYLLWPIIFWTISKKKLHFLSITIFIFIASFLANIYLTYFDSVGAFYFPIARFWELMIGSILALLIIKYKEDLEGKEIFSILGFLLLVIGFVFVNIHRQFPGWWALFPTIGTSLIILGGPLTKVNQSLFSNKLVIFLGIISYPLYLWHWLLLSFLHIVILKPSSFEIISIVLVSTCLAWITFRFIEKPIRNGQHNKIKICVLIVLMVVVGFVGLNTYNREGLNFRDVSFNFYLNQINKKMRGEELSNWSKNKTNRFNLFYSDQEESKIKEKYIISIEKLISKMKTDPEFLKTLQNDFTSVNKLNDSSRPIQVCEDQKQDCFEKKSILIIGDSHAGNVHQSLSYAFKNFNFILLNGAGCTPISLRYTNENNNCLLMLQKAHELTKNKKFEAVILTARWPNNFEPVLNEITFFRKYVSKVILVGPSLDFETEVNKILLRYTQGNPVEYIDSFVNTEKFEINYRMRLFSIQNNIDFIDNVAYFCYSTFCPLTEDGNQLFIFDADHSTSAGMVHLGDSLLRNNVLNKILKSSSAIQLP